MCCWRRSSTPRTTRSRRLIFLFGPTGVGKTALLERLFSTGFQVVNADSKQIYRFLDIGSAKPEPDLLRRIPHHLIDIKDPWEPFSVGEFVKLADDACDLIRHAGDTPIICGGTAYYFKHFYFGMPASPPSDQETRQRIADLAKEHGLPWCHRWLASVDPISANRIHPSDGYRITRALEVHESSGKPLSSFSIPTEARNGMHPLIIGLLRDTEELSQRIERRVARMFDAGLEDEMKRLLGMGAEASWPGMLGIGYQEFFLAHEHPEWTVEDIARQIVRNSRLYAKRQMTFFKSLPRVHWVHPDDMATLSMLVESHLSAQGPRGSSG